MRLMAICFYVCLVCLVAQVAFLIVEPSGFNVFLLAWDACWTFLTFLSWRAEVRADG